MDDVLGDKCYVMCVPMTYHSTFAGCVVVASDVSDSTSIWRSLAGIFAFIASVVLIITFIGTFLMAKEQTKPLKDMAQAAHRFAHGDFDPESATQAGRTK
jgi:signal transduction histidine kinase